MIGRVVLAVILAGIAAGFIMGAIQHVRLTPLILAAEAFERVDHTHDHSATQPEGATDAEGSTAAHDHDHGAGWAPENGWQRTLATTVTAVMAGAGFAAVLAGISLVTGLPITRQNGIVWGLCGFIAVTLAPSAGLPPELPGMTAAELWPRQIWWVGTIAATSAGIYLIATRRELWALIFAALLVLVPHVIGAPAAAHEPASVPPGLVATFVANAIAANAIFWICIGLFLGLVLDRTAKDIYAT